MTRRRSMLRSNSTCSVGLAIGLLLGLLSLSSVGQVALAPPSQAAGQSVDAFVNQWNGKFAKFDGVYGAQCVDLFDFYNRDVVGAPSKGFGHAYTIFDAASSSFYSKHSAGSGYVPVKGDVAIWGSNLPFSGGAGHVAIVLERVSSTSLKVLSQNRGANDGPPTPGLTSDVDVNPTEIMTHSTSYLRGYLHPLSLPAGNAPPPPDEDVDGVPDNADFCPSVAGPGLVRGCPEALLREARASTPDANGDGKGDYCRRVGGVNNKDSYLACTLSTGSGFGATISSGVVDWGYDFGRAWTDANGDGKADYCRVVGSVNHQSSHVTCTLSTGSGFGGSFTSGVVDWGYELGRAWVDANGDGKGDYCRRVGGVNNKDSYLACTLSTGSGFGATISSGVVDWGYDFGRAWTDANGDGKADYCRVVGSVNHQSSHVTCTLSTGSGFGGSFTSGVVDWGYELGRAWVDANGDGKADYCRRVGGVNNKDSYLACTLSTGSGFGATISSGVVDWGYDFGRAWTDANGDGKADYCRVVGVKASAAIACTLSTGAGFSATTSSGNVDWGYDTGRSWVDADGDGRSDYCRRVGGVNHETSYLTCTLSTGTGFGGGLTSGVVDWGYPDAEWAGTGLRLPLIKVAGPTIAGPARVGSELRATPGVWTPPGSTTYRWLADGSVIPGATSSRYTPTASVVGKRISVRVTAAKVGYASRSATSMQTPVVVPGLITNSTLPSISGNRRVGATLTANRGSWEPGSLTYHYQWFRGASAITGATAKTYVLPRSVRGYKIRVRVTASRAGYTRLAKFSAYTVPIS